MTQIQLLKSGCSNSLRIALKVLVAFRVNIALQLILPFPQSCTHHEEFQRPSGSPSRSNVFHWLSKESWQNLPSLLTGSTSLYASWALDPKDLNRAIKRPHYFTPTLEDVLPNLNGAKCFLILDTRSGYWNIKLTMESSLLTTFNSLF